MGLKRLDTTKTYLLLDILMNSSRLPPTCFNFDSQKKLLSIIGRTVKSTWTPVKASILKNLEQADKHADKHANSVGMGKHA